ncbi:MAG: hypothetical protein K8U57_11895 [Planctomycetes bacterium]|nr:hypothetical protein [Planctomycetota bacterium]
MAEVQLRRWGCLTAIALLLIATGALTAWVYWQGCFSHANYTRIRDSMSREQVAELLGSSGEETKSIPCHPSYVQKPGYPPGWTGVVWGDTFIHWQDGSRGVYVGFVEGRVVSKCYLEPSL